MSATALDAGVEVLGIRHHGPGSARSVVAALERISPDVVLVEGPADADAIVPLAVEAGMEPPVALLAYAVDDPSIAAFWPMALFSPEWQAITWALEHDVPVRFCDLPAATTLATSDRERREGDPLGRLAAAAGYDDPERWWDLVVEGRHHRDAGPFAEIAEAMAELRADEGSVATVDLVREAHMRRVLRSVTKAGAQRVAAVVGAWYAPALQAPLPTAISDAALLKGRPKRKVGLTWVPWTHSRLASSSGYGAGVDSPGWYSHLFSAPGSSGTDDVVARWMTRVAGVLRAEDLPVSSASVIESVRLAEALSGMRDRGLAGLAEVSDAAGAVLCDGDDRLLGIVTKRLVVGEALGTVPETVPTVPLDADLRATARRLRLQFSPVVKELDLDLRSANGLERSHLLHRLRLLDVPWGEPAVSRSTGTFRESWELVWEPGLSVSVVEASLFGTTVASAAAAKVTAAAAHETDVVVLTRVVERSLMADLPDAVPSLLGVLDERAARSGDVLHLMAALPALVRAARYGDVRGMDTGAVAAVGDALLLRICAGLPAAVGSLDDDAAADVRGKVDGVHASVSLRDDDVGHERWRAVLLTIADRTDVHPLLVGRCVRLLRDAGAVSEDDAAARFGRALSVGPAPAEKAAWVEGFLSGGGMLLVHDGPLLGLVDGWLQSLAAQEFTDVLPLLRRTFSTVESGARRVIGEQVRRGPGAVSASPAEDLDVDRARPAVLAVARILGLRS